MPDITKLRRSLSRRKEAESQKNKMLEAIWQAFRCAGVATFPDTHTRLHYTPLIHSQRSRREDMRERHDSRCESVPAQEVQIPAVRRKYPDGRKVPSGWARAEFSFLALNKRPLCQLFALSHVVSMPLDYVEFFFLVLRTSGLCIHFYLENH